MHFPAGIFGQGPWPIGPSRELRRYVFIQDSLPMRGKILAQGRYGSGARCYRMAAGKIKRDLIGSSISLGTRARDRCCGPYFVATYERSIQKGLGVGGEDP